MTVDPVVAGSSPVALVDFNSRKYFCAMYLRLPRWRACETDFRPLPTISQDFTNPCPDASGG